MSLYCLYDNFSVTWQFLRHRKFALVIFGICFCWILFSILKNPNQLHYSKKVIFQVSKKTSASVYDSDEFQTCLPTVRNWITRQNIWHLTTAQDLLFSEKKSKWSELSNCSGFLPGGTFKIVAQRKVPKQSIAVFELRSPVSAEGKIHRQRAVEICMRVLTLCLITKLYRHRVNLHKDKQQWPWSYRWTFSIACTGIG